MNSAEIIELNPFRRDPVVRVVWVDIIVINGDDNQKIQLGFVQ